MWGGTGEWPNTKSELLPASSWRKQGAFAMVERGSQKEMGLLGSMQGRERAQELPAQAIPQYHK